MARDRDTPSPTRNRDETKEQRKRRRREKRERREVKRVRREARAADGPPSSPSEKRPRKNEDFVDGAPPQQGEGLFVWKKKIEQQRRRGEFVGPHDEVHRREELAAELVTAKQRRAERDAERAEWEAEQALEAREREQEQNADWHRSEATFHGTQHFLRQAIRLRQNRCVGSDSLAKNLRLDLMDVNADEKDPVERLAAMELDLTELEHLAEDVEKELDYIPDFPRDGDNDVFNRQVRVSWWECVKVCVQGMLESSRGGGQEGGVHRAVQGDVDAMLNGKRFEKLVDMEREVSKRLEDGDTGPNCPADEYAEAEFWSAALTRIRRRISELRLTDMNSTLVDERAKRVAALPQEDRPSREVAHQSDDRPAGELDFVDLEAAKGMGSDEEKFCDEVEVHRSRHGPVAGYAWNDKYRPRKPKYYNRVHTGYDWSKYNRTHYDRDNPPPKTVQGYRFNIFYPDLIDSSKTPTYTITKTDNPGVCILTIKAGPPYEDLAFKIVNRQWEHSHRRGYRCSFDKGILRMWFNFQRYRYRR